MIVGHKKITDDLTKLASAGSLGHAYLFYGPEMVGKRMAAMGLAKFLEKGVFEQIKEGEVLQDMKLIDLAFAKQLDPGKSGESIGIGAVREIKHFLWQRPNVSPRRTLVIDEAELLTVEAQNALLKITEEPPESSLLIIVSPHTDSFLPTILSRVEKVYFGLVPGSEIASWLTHERKLPAAAAKDLAARSFGKPGLAVRFLDDVALRENIVLAERLLKVPPAGRRDLIKEILDPDDFSFPKFIDALMLALAAEKESATRDLLWHRVLALAERESNFTLNPRLQLENLFVRE